MVSSETYQFVPGDVSNGAQVKTIERGYLSLPIVPSTKTASWENLNELDLFNSAGGTLQGAQLPSSARVSFSNGLGGLSVSHMDSREGQMGAYFSGSDGHGEAIQTLHLMNPPFSGYADTALHTDDMVPVHPSAAAVRHNNYLDHPSQLQQNYLGFLSSSSSFTQASILHQSPISSVYNASMVTQPISQQTSLFSNRIGSNTWAAGSEYPFLPVNDMAQLTQPLAARLACMEPGQQQPSSCLNQLVSRPNRVAHDDHGSMLCHDIALGLTTDNLQASPGSNQRLSLSLSAQHDSLQLQCFGLQPGAAVLSHCQGLLQNAPEDGSRDNQYSHRWVGNSDQLEASSHSNHFSSAYHFSGLDSSNRQLPLEATVQPVPGFRGYLTGSKYLRVAHFLLEEVVSLGCGLKYSSSKHTKLQSWIGGGALLDSSSLKDENAASGTLTNPKEGVCVVSTTQKTLISSSSEQNLALTERNLQENQELQLKKAKLVAMLDEVDRRYKLYFSQMEAVVNTFESAAGLGAAKTYTALALQTISKHFRGLRDAIGSQIRASSRALGEEEFSSLGLGRLRYVDQQLRQQRALGMMQQHAWRPQRGLPERSVSVLRAWLFEHFLHPYPKDADKHMLARQTGLSRNQVSNWFINARVRLWKPMVEEMYLEELKEAEMDRTSAETSADQKSNTETSDNHRSGISCMDDQAGVGVPDSSNTHGRDEVGSQDLGVMQLDKQMVPSYQPASSTGLPHTSGLDGRESHLLQEIPKGGVLNSFEQGLKPDNIRREEEFEGHSRHSFRARGLDHHSYGGYYDQGGGLSAVPAGYNGVSLSLGLQHSDGVSLASGQQHFYVQQQQNHLQNQEGVTGSLFSQLAMTGSRRRLDEMEECYSCDDSSKNYEALGEIQTRKRFASNMYNQG